MYNASGDGGRTKLVTRSGVGLLRRKSRRANRLTSAGVRCNPSSLDSEAECCRGHGAVDRVALLLAEGGRLAPTARLPVCKDIALGLIV